MKNFLRQFSSLTRMQKADNFTQPVRAFFTTTSEEQNEHSYSFFPSAVGAKPRTVKKERGFTMIELLVAIGVFATALTMAMTGLLATIDASSRTRGVSETVNNLNFVVDDMARRIRTGYDFNCGSPTGGDCLNGDDFFSFTDSRGLDTSSHPEVRYQQNGSHIERWEGGSWKTITPDSITIDTLLFYLTGTTDGDDEQTRVTISIAGTAGEGDVQESFEIQTSITQRLLYPSN